MRVILKLIEMSKGLMKSESCWESRRKILPEILFSYAKGEINFVRKQNFHNISQYLGYKFSILAYIRLSPRINSDFSYLFRI